MPDIVEYARQLWLHNQELISFSSLLLAVFVAGTRFAPTVRWLLGRRENETQQERDLERQLSEKENKLTIQEAELASRREASTQQAEQLALLQDALDTERQAQHALASADQALWNKRQPRPPEGYALALNNARTPIITVANLKGGVGKTTLTANLAAYFALAKGKRVLLIDTDFQRSLSNLLQTAVKDTSVSLRLSDWLQDDIPPAQLIQSSCGLNPLLPGSAMVTSSYELAPFEQQLMAKWWFADNAKDARYALARNLLSREVQDRFDIIIIDAPPRLSISAINALSASTHLLIPTTLDPLSTDAVITFLQMIKTLRASLLPGLQVAGIIPTMTTPTMPQLSRAETSKLETLKRDLQQVGLRSPAYIFSRNIPRWNAFAQGIAYCSHAGAKGILDSLGDELCRQIGIIDEGARVLTRAPLPRAANSGPKRAQRRN